jgi:hypothetical protein
MTAGRGGGGWRDTQSSTTFRDRKRTHTMVRVQGGLYGEGHRKDFRTSGGVLWPKTRNEQSDRSREIDIPHPPQAVPHSPRSHARPFVRVLARARVHRYRRLGPPNLDLVFASSLASQIHRHIPQKNKLAQSTGTQDRWADRTRDKHARGRPRPR